MRTRLWHAGSRDTTTVAMQALYLLNDPFVRQQSVALAGRLMRLNDSADANRITEDRIRFAYRLALCRPATDTDIERAKNYLTDYESTARFHGLIAPNDVQTAAWTSFCQAILASAEFRYAR